MMIKKKSMLLHSCIMYDRCWIVNYLAATVLTTWHASGTTQPCRHDGIVHAVKQNFHPPGSVALRANPWRPQTQAERRKALPGRAVACLAFNCCNDWKN